MIFEIDTENLAQTAELIKMEFIQNKIFAYTEQQDTETGKNFKLSNMTACGEACNDKDFKPINVFNNAAVGTHTQGVQIITTEQIRTHVNDLTDITFGFSSKMDNRDIEGLCQQSENVATTTAPEKKNKPEPRFKPCTLDKAHKKLKS